MDALTAIQNLTDMSNFVFLRDRLFNSGAAMNLFPINGDFNNFGGNQLVNPSPKFSGEENGEDDLMNEIGENGEGNRNQEFNETPSSSLSSSSSSSSSSLLCSSVIPSGTVANVKLIDFRGHKVAAFDINEKEMICLPQVYELFLKNMVGGLHTVYTKLRRLDIHPLICNVDQVRALRGLGAIQPGVNRCKLIECSQFDKLYDDCTSTCTRPGRPSKRGGGNNGFDDWTTSSLGVVKKEKSNDTASTESAAAAAAAAATAKSNAAVFNQLLPQFTTHQLLMQHFVALTQQKNNNNTNNNNNFDGNEDEDGRQRTSGDGTPLNLSKSGNSENDSDSLRKEDSSPNNSCSDRAGSNSNSLSAEGSSSNRGGNTDDSGLINKVLGLVEIASEQFKHERQELWRERNEIQLLRESFHKIVQEERDLRKKLESQTKRCSFFQKRYSHMRRRMMMAKMEKRRKRQMRGTRERRSSENDQQ